VGNCQQPSQLGMFIGDYKQQEVSIKRMVELIPDEPPEVLVEHHPVYDRGAFPKVPYITKTPAHRLDTLEARGLTYRYPGTDNGIAEIDLHLVRGSFTVIAGRIGSGKTTLLRVLLGLCQKTRAKSYGMGNMSPTRRHFSKRLVAPMQPRFRACSAIRYGTIS